MTSYIEDGYAQEVEESKYANVTGKVWYLPHHPVINPRKPGKVRVVFDCAAKFKGTSLNDQLLQGPDPMNSIVGVLMRFRQELVALIADIEAMFHQVKVKDEDRNSLRFLWWPDGDMSCEAREYCMTVHLFGGTSSPSCAAFSLRRTAEDHTTDYSENTIQSVYRNFYVDDLLKSVRDAKVGVHISAELRELLFKRGFRLTKWLSNSKIVMDSIPESEKAKSVSIVDIEDNDTLSKRTLGLQWKLKDDAFVFEVQMAEKPLTRRGILSVASLLYDPLGLVAPVTLIPKLLLQNACRQGLRWDELVSKDDVDIWEKWKDKLPLLKNVSIKRCLKPLGLDESSYTVELHFFSDASEVAYGAAAYARIYDTKGYSKCTLLMGKSRLAPIKTMSVPRLELAAAVVAVKLSMLINKELDMRIVRSYFWTDSMIVLVRNGSKHTWRID